MRLNDPYKKGAVYSSSLSIVGRLVAFVQNLVIAYYLGATGNTDIYFYLFNLCVLIAAMGQSITTSVIIPYSINLRTQNNKKEEMSYVNAFLLLVVAIGAILILASIFLGDGVMKYISGFDLDNIRRNRIMLYLFPPITLLFLLNLVLSEILSSHKLFVYPIALNLLNNVFIILFIVLFSSSIDILSAVMGIGIGSFINFCWLLLTLKTKVKWNFSLINFVAIRKTIPDISSIVINQLFAISFSAFPLYLLSSLHPGTVTIANYGMKLAQTPISILFQILSVFQIKYNELASNKAFVQIKQLYRRLTSSLFLITLVGALILFVFKDFIINLLYGHSDMGADSISTLIDYFGILLFSLPFTIVGVASSKLFFSLRQVKTYSLIIILCGAISCIINYFFIKYQGDVGYAYAFILSELILATALTSRGYRLLLKAIKL